MDKRLVKESNRKHCFVWRHALAAVCCALVFAGHAAADLVTMADGRQFEGQILVKDSQIVRIDTVIAGIRATLTLKYPEIKSVVDCPVPDGYFDPPPVAERISKTASFATTDNLYLTVPIVGTFGQTVFADGLRNILAYATQYKIRHIVFLVDSDGGSLDEATAAYELLKKYNEQLTYHAIVRHCVGDALAIPLWCNTLHLFPGATVGGSNRKWSEISDKIEAQEEAIIRSQVAVEVVLETREHRQHVRGSAIVRAMIDPAATIAVWRDEQGQLVTGAKAPSDLPPGRIVLEDGPESVLVLSYDQAIALGAQPFPGDVEQLGSLLGLPNWKLESDFGQKAMKRAVTIHHNRAKEVKANYESKAKQNIHRRRTTERYIEHNLRQAASWDPSEASYTTYSSRWRWGSTPTTRLTRESREKWRDRTDASMHYLRRAAKGLTTIKKLDQEAAELGLEQTYETEQLGWMMKDVDAKYKYLHAHRKKKNK